MDMTCSVAPMAVAKAERASRTRVSMLFLPDVALVVSLLTLVYCLVFFDGTRNLFRDSDAGWHIRTGERILAGEGLPRADAYSFTRAGQPWFAWEWGADGLMGLLHRSGGPAYVAGLYAVAIAACTWLWFRLQWIAGGHFLLACGLAIPLLTTANIHWHARPHVFSWLFILCTILLCETRSARSLAAVAIGSVLWTNLHASFFLGPAILSIYGAGSLLASFLWNDMDGEDSTWFFRAAAIAALATLANPYGWHLHDHVVRYLFNRELLDRVGEFQSFNFHVEGAGQIVLTFAVGAFGVVTALAQRRLAHALLMGIFLVMALRSARVLPIVALVCLPLANGAITAALRGAKGLRSSVRTTLDGFLQYGDNLRTLDRGLSGIAIVPLALAVTFVLLGVPAVAARAGFPPEQFPVAAVERIPASARLLAPDFYGGYLIYRFEGRQKVFFDGRSDFYGAAYMKEYLKLIEVRPGWQAELERHAFTHALLPVRYSLVPALETLGWKRIYSDDVAVLMAAAPHEKD